MKKIITLSVCMLMVSCILFAQYSIDWVRPADSYLKTGAMIARDNADNVIVTGYNMGIFTRKYDKFGNFLWESASVSGIQSNYEKSMWVNTDNNNNIYVVGYRYVIASAWEYPNAVVILKYNPSGTLLWKQNVSLGYVVGSSTGLRFNLRSEVDNNGNVYVGTAATAPSGFVLIKLSPGGTVLVNTVKNLGVVHSFRSMRLKDNKVILSGSASNNINVAAVAWDTTGTFLWSTVLNGYTGNDVEIDNAGNAYILSWYPNQVSPTSGHDIVIYKLNSAGAQIWKNNYDFGGQELATRFTLVSDKISVIAYGTLSSPYLDWITFQTDASGTLLWSARYDGTSHNDERPYFISAKASGEVFVTGIGGPTPVPYQLSWLRMVTLKYSNTGTRQWLDTVNVNGGAGLACTLASDNSLFIVSQSHMTAYHFLDLSGTGSCGISSGLNVTNITNTSAGFSWSSVPGANLYHLRYKTSTATEWTSISTNLTSINLNVFTQGTSYNYAVEAICSSGSSGFSTTQSFTTTGTGYCSTGGQSTASEYLNLVWIGNLQNNTGNNNGYADFTNLSTNLTAGSGVSGYFRGSLGGGFVEYYRVWIDYNLDGDFNDAGEEVASISSSSIGYNAVSFIVPANATPGVTRMRVTMQYGSAPAPCGAYPRGETEDYTVVIIAPPTPTCTDGIQNGDETGIDCGGSCPACPTCTDGIQNGNETGIDCGGSCPACPTCTDGIQNGNETGIDCGGSCPACPTSCNFVQLNSNNFESGWGIWNDGGNDCNRVSQSAYANSGTYSIQLRDNTSSSVMTTNNLNLTQYQKIKIRFSYITVSMDNPNEDFWLQVSTNGGQTYTTVAEWNLNDEFVNNQRNFDSVMLEQAFTSTTRFRFRCDASDDNDWVYLDDVIISGCTLSARGGPEPVITETAEHLKLYPNPVTDKLTIENTKPGGIEKVEIINVLGNTVSVQFVNSLQKVIVVPMQNLQPGMYFIRITDKDNIVTTKKIIKN